LQVLIVAKTRRGSGACIGAITSDGRSLRLEAANAAGDNHSGMEYQIGDVWTVQVAPHPQIVPPHVETVIVYGKHRVRSGVDPIRTIERFMPPVSGGIPALYEGKVQAAESGSLYISQANGLPACSTVFWQPDRPLRLADNGLRLHYCYEDNAGEAPCSTRLAFVGFQEPIDEIPSGAIVRVSLAHWWRPADRPEEELRCYLQLSGWFLPPGDKGASVTSQADEFAYDRGENLAGAEPDPVHRLLKDVFGYDSFRPLQEEIVGALLARRDTLAVMPTGAGKSLCYQLPALIWPRLTVVVSPLIALMQDQVDALRELGVPAAFLNSTLTYGEQRNLMERVRGGQIKLLYLAPEALVRPEVLHMLDAAGVDCLAIDEAHCISSWGHDFRPEYRQLAPVRRRFASAVCLAMTATAAPRVRADIKQSLDIPAAGEFLASFDRPNLFLSAQPRSNGRRQLLDFLSAHREQSGIVYCATKRQVDSLAELLQGRGYASLPYHAGLDDDTRRRNQRAFVRDEAAIIVATVAFGMGINKSNVRFVVHYNMPSSIEAYYQEIGRSGRDGVRADCLLLYQQQDVQFHATLIDEGAAEERSGRNARLQAMLRYAQGHGCRRPPLLSYFGETPGEERCGFCDHCLAQEQQRPQTDVTVAAQKFFSCVLRTGEVFGYSHIVDVLRGSRSQKVLQRRHEELSTYGIGREYSAAQWRALAQQWIEQGLLRQDMEHGGLSLTETGRQVLRGQEKAFAELEPQVAEVEGSPAHSRQSAGLPSYDQGLFDELRRLRREQAQSANLPPYMIFSDRALIEMAAYLPRTDAEFMAINGVGRAKLQSLGPQFIAAIADYSAAHGLQPQPQAHPPALAPPAYTPPPQQHKGSGKGGRAQEIGKLYATGASLANLQELYGVKRSTIIAHLRDYLRDGGAIDGMRIRAECLLPPAVQEQVLAQFAVLSGERLTPVYEVLEGAVDYEDLHLLRLIWQTRHSTSG
jgi:ATP-dependent DNA helicase RecQ